MPLLNAAVQTAKWTWDSIDRAVSRHRTLGEESVTDFFLLEFTDLTQGSVRVVDISKIQESKIGADWEWWFVDSEGYSLPFRVQAKIIDFSSPNVLSNPEYRYLHYSGKSKKNNFKPGHQTNRLIRRAMVDHMLPLYCLYTNFDNGFSPVAHSCYAYGSKNESFGISLIGANEVRQNHSTSLSDIFFDVHAFECLFNDAYTLLHMQEWFMRRYSVSITRYGDNYIRDPKNLPSYIKNAIAADGLPTDLIINNDTNRITIFLMSQDVLEPMSVLNSEQ